MRAPACRERRNHHPGEDLARLERGGVDAAVEARGGNLARGAAPGHAQHRVQRHRAGGQLGGGIGLSETAPHRAASAKGQVRDMWHGLRHQGRMARHQRGPEHRLLSRERADRKSLRSEVDGVEAGQAGDVHQGRRRGQPHVERGDETLPAGENPGVGSVAFEQMESLAERGGTVIGEGRGLHRRGTGGSLP